MINASINIFIYTAVFLVIGLINPQFALFFMNKPTRLTIVIFSLIAFMIGATLFGEGERQKKVAAQIELQKKAPQIQNDPDEIPIKIAPATPAPNPAAE